MRPPGHDLLCYFRRLAPHPAPGDGDAAILSRYLHGDGAAFTVLAAVTLLALPALRWFERLDHPTGSGSVVE